MQGQFKKFVLHRYRKWVFIHDSLSATKNSNFILCSRKEEGNFVVDDQEVSVEICKGVTLSRQSAGSQLMWVGLHQHTPTSWSPG